MPFSCCLMTLVATLTYTLTLGLPVRHMPTHGPLRFRQPFHDRVSRSTHLHRPHHRHSGSINAHASHFSQTASPALRKTTQISPMDESLSAGLVPGGSSISAGTNFKNLGVWPEDAHIAGLTLLSLPVAFPSFVRDHRRTTRPAWLTQRPDSGEQQTHNAIFEESESSDNSNVDSQDTRKNEPRDSSAEDDQELQFLESERRKVNRLENMDKRVYGQLLSHEKKSGTTTSLLCQIIGFPISHGCTQFPTTIQDDSDATFTRPASSAHSASTPEAPMVRRKDALPMYLLGGAVGRR